MSETAPLYVCWPGDPGPCRGTPGHYLSPLILIGDVTAIHTGHGGHITGVLVTVDDGARLAIVVLAERWPPALAVGARVWVKGALRVEPEVHRKNLFYVQAQQFEVLARR